MSLGLRGDCLTCSKIATCKETSIQKVQESFTCIFFNAVPEPVWEARETMIQQYGEVRAIEAMLNRPQQGEEEDGD